MAEAGMVRGVRSVSDALGDDGKHGAYSDPQLNPSPETEDQVSQSLLVSDVEGIQITHQHYFAGELPQSQSKRHVESNKGGKIVKVGGMKMSDGKGEDGVKRGCKQADHEEDSNTAQVEGGAHTLERQKRDGETCGDALPRRRLKPTVDDFEWGEDLGEGSFGTVRRAKLRSSGEEFAIKILEKKHVIKMDKVKYVTSERDILFQLNHPNVIKLYYTFQDQNCLYYVLELAPGGELFDQIQKFGPASKECARFYTAEIVNAMEYLHSKGVVHRDLKPENMLVSGDGHIKISDFGSATKQESEADVKLTFVGTAEFVSPEVLDNKSATQSSDLWALGCVLYQMLTGNPPFRGETDYLIFQKVLRCELSFPRDFPNDAKDLVERLLVLDPTRRLGASGKMKELKDHAFFEGVDFKTLHFQTPPPFLRKCASMGGNSASRDLYCAFDSFNRPMLSIAEVQKLKNSGIDALASILPSGRGHHVDGIGAEEGRSLRPASAIHNH